LIINWWYCPTRLLLTTVAKICEAFLLIKAMAKPTTFVAILSRVHSSAESEYLQLQR
jgi:hypothetical protein